MIFTFIYALFAHCTGGFEEFSLIDIPVQMNEKQLLWLAQICVLLSLFMFLLRPFQDNPIGRIDQINSLIEVERAETAENVKHYYDVKLSRYNSETEELAKGKPHAASREITRSRQDGVKEIQSARGNRNRINSWYFQARKVVDVTASISFDYFMPLAFLLGFYLTEFGGAYICTDNVVAAVSGATNSSN